MVTKTVNAKSLVSPGGDQYGPDDLFREWVRNKEPYANKIGPFVSWRRTRRSGIHQDAYWNPASNAGKDWVVNTTQVPSSVLDPMTDGCFSDNVRKKTIYKLQEQIAKSDFNLAVSGAEAVKTVELITHTAARLLKAALALKKGRLGDAYATLGLSPKPTRRPPKPKKVRENAGNYWLEMQYGWKPLLSDIDGGCKALAEMLNKPDVPIFYAEARSTDREFSVVRQKGGSSTWAFDTDWDVKYQQSCRIGVTYRIRSGEIVQAARLGLTNPALVVWEVVPFSFVVDWFIPVGDFLSQISAYHGLEFVNGYQTQFYKGIALHSAINRIPNGVRFSGPPTLIQGMRQRRTSLSDFPYAGLILKNPFSASHAVTTLALLQGVLGGFTKKQGLRL